MAFAPPFSRPFSPTFDRRNVSQVSGVYCTFTGADGTNLTSYAWPSPDYRPGINQWSSYAGTWTIDTNTAKKADAATTNVAVVDSGIIGATLSVKITVVGTCGIAARMTAINNGWIIEVGGTTLKIYEGTGSGYTQRATTSGTFTNGSTLTVTFTGNTIAASYQAGSCSYASATRNNTVTVHGLYAYNNTSRLDDFLVS